MTGGNGYIGRFCVHQLRSAGHSVTVLDRTVAARTNNALGSVRGDIADQQLVVRLLHEQGIETVLHLAADKSVEESMQLPGPHLRNNVAGSLTLLEAMRIAGVRRIVFSSSAAVYGVPSQLPVTEDTPLLPVNPYGAGKAMVEQILHWYHVCHGFVAISLRYFNAAGAAPDGSMGEDWTGAANLVPRVMKALLGASDALPVYGTDFPTPDGTAIRDYVHVEDLAEAHVRALELVMENEGDWAVNLGAGQGHSVREVIDAAERASGRVVPAFDAPRRPGDPPAIWADTSHARRLLDWRAERDLDEIVRTAWLWHSRSGG